MDWVNTYIIAFFIPYRAMSGELRAMSLRSGLTAKATFCQRQPLFPYNGTPFATLLLGTLFLIKLDHLDGGSL